MTFLLLSILCSSCLPLLFKAFQGWQVSIAWAVSLNYLACTLWGSLFSLGPAGPSLPLFQPWIPVALLQGLLLAGNFYLLANTAQRAGVAIASLSSRLSVAIPVLAAIPLYGESLDFLKSAGICGALVALYLGTAPSKGAKQTIRLQTFILPVVVFFSFGFHFTLLKYAQHFHLSQDQHHQYLMISFFFALLFSLAVLSCTQRNTTALLSKKTWLGGLFLGSCNYFALFLMTRVLSYEDWPSSVVFPTHSVGVVLVSTVAAVLLFSETLSLKRTFGLIIGSFSVVALNIA